MRSFRNGPLAAVAVLLISAWAGRAVALYEDQAGTSDWYKPFFGRPQNALFSPGKDRVYLATQQNLLVSLQLKTGNVAWRRQYTEADSLDDVIVLQSPALAVSASRGCKTLRAWDAMEGGFRWEALVYQGRATITGGCALSAVKLKGQKHSAVAVAAGGTLQLLGASKGDQLWSVDLEGAAAEATHAHLVTDDDVISVVTYTPGSLELTVSGCTAADGSISRSPEQLAAAAPLGATSAVSGSSVAILTDGQRELCVLPHPGAAELLCVGLDTLAPGLLGDTPGALQLAAAAPGAFSLSSPAGVALVAVNNDGELQQLHWAEGPVVATPAASVGSPGSDAGSSILGLVSGSSDGSSIHIKLLSAATAEQLGAVEVPVPSTTYQVSGPAPTVVAAWLDGSRRKETSGSKGKVGALSGCRLVVLWSDDLLVYVEDGRALWSREEALATVSSSLLLELPSAKAAAGGSGALESSSSGSSGSSKVGLLAFLQDKEQMRQWMRLQVLSVLVQFKLNTDAEKEEFYSLRQALSDNNLPYRDSNGFRKLIVVLTAPGKLFGLHSGDGRILWASSAAVTGDSSSSSSSSSSSTQYLRLWRRFHDLTHAPEVAVLTAGHSQSAVHVMNAHTGQQLQHTELPYGVDKVIGLQAPVHGGAAEQFSFFLVEQLPPAAADSIMKHTPRVHLLPDLPSTREALAANSSNTFFWLQQPLQQAAAADVAGQTVLRGFSLVPGAAAAEEADADALLPVVQAWQVALPGRLLALTTREPTEPVHSYVKILGDRSLKYKYINPNLLFVASAPHAPPTHTDITGSTAASRKQSAEQRQVSVALVNTVTGAVLYQQVHEGAAGPVHAVVSEHWVVYAFRDVVNLREQATVVELYDASPRDLSIESIILGRTQHAERVSSYTAQQLEVLTQSFYLQHAITGLSVSQTQQGITTKQLLLHTQSNQVYALDKRYLDPRRPMAAKATPQEAEEGLLPYSELIIFNTLLFATQDKQVLNLRGVTAAPAVLESTCLVFCYGSDLFFTRITPAAHFDSLASDFSYGLLVVALVVLIVLTLVVRNSSQQAVVKAKWE